MCTVYIPLGAQLILAGANTTLCLLLSLSPMGVVSISFTSCYNTHCVHCRKTEFCNKNKSKSGCLGLLLGVVVGVVFPAECSSRGMALIRPVVVEPSSQRYNSLVIILHVYGGVWKILKLWPLSCQFSFISQVRIHVHSCNNTSTCTCNTLQSVGYGWSFLETSITVGHQKNPTKTCMWPSMHCCSQNVRLDKSGIHHCYLTLLLTQHKHIDQHCK